MDTDTLEICTTDAAPIEVDSDLSAAATVIVTSIDPGTAAAMLGSLVANPTAPIALSAALIFWLILRPKRRPPPPPAQK